MGAISMESFETHTHSFVVKIWLEESAEEAGRARWRGHITHVPGGERAYVQSLSGIAVFIAAYLRRMGVRPGWGWCVRLWLNGLKPHGR